MTRTWSVLGFCVCMGLSIPAARAGESTAGADALLQAADKNTPRAAAPATGAVPSQLRNYTFKDPFSLQLFASWQAMPRMPYLVDQWVGKVLDQDYAGAAHLWSQVVKEMPADFLPVAELTQVYLLWKLDLAQEFVDQLLVQLRNPQQRSGKMVGALQQTLEPGFASWLINRAVTVNADQARSILEDWTAELSGTVFDSLRAWTLLRSGTQKKEAAMLLMERLPADHPLKIPFAQTIALGLARAEQLADAGKLLKQHLEPAVLKSGKPELLAQYYLQIARLLYQADALDASEAFYRKVPNNRPEFLVAREELGWILLRKGDQTKLKGELKNFRLGLTDDKFLPETFVVSAIANLKGCHYRETQDDINAFTKNQRAWAERVQKEVAAASPSRPLETGFFVELSDRAYQNREEELQRLRKLAQESINSALPAVGVQVHWEEAIQRQQLALQLSGKVRNEEYRRVWKNWSNAISEAIRKMKFVRVELLSQLSTKVIQQSGGKQALSVGGAKLALQQDKDSVVFPFDGVVWNDELFNLQSLSEGSCL